MRKFLMTILAAFVVFNLYSGNYKLSEINIRIRLFLQTPLKDGIICIELPIP